jgi:choline dehydrogenase-like flavoprotein
MSQNERAVLLSPSVPASVELTSPAENFGSFSSSKLSSSFSSSSSSSSSSSTTTVTCPLVVTAFGAVSAALLLAVALWPNQICDIFGVGCAPHDFIIIGAGPAGSAIAHHLGADFASGVSAAAAAPLIQVLEAGGPSQHATGGDDYLYSNLTVFDVPLAWSYVAHLEQYHWHMQGDAILAKAVGGCGVHNAMLYVRAMPQNIESWNMSKWQWGDIYDQYLRLENYDGSSVFAEYHGSGGPMMTSPPIFEDLLGQKFLETTHLLGIRQSGDFNEPQGRVGAGYYHFNIRHGVRDGAAATLLTPTIAKHPERVSLREFTTVQKLNFVDYTGKSGETLKRVESLDLANAEGEAWSQPISKDTRVVLTAGAVNTPAILMR